MELGTSFLRRPRFPSVLVLTTLLALALAPPARAADPRGFLYGKITTSSGETYEGRLRWDGEEAFWSDHFNSTKDERPYLDRAPEREREERREPIRIFGVTIGWRGWDEWDGWSRNRSFLARFGDLRKIEPVGRDGAILTMRNGSVIEVDGGSNDLGADVSVWDPELGEIALDWRRIETIEFLPTPADLEVADKRLFGTVHSAAGEFRGFIQWDQDEGLTSDKLDGDSRDGEMAIEMGKIRAIERRGRDRARVTLASGREIELDGSNDVDDSNRGVFVDDPRYGRVLVSWDAFERVELEEAPGSGVRYDEIEPGRKLRGAVTDRDGRVHRGRLVYDLDEEETWEILGGERRGVAYNVPFARIAAVIPDGEERSRVVLRNGEELVLADSADVGEGNDGVLVLPLEGEGAVYVAWEDVERVDFEG